MKDSDVRITPRWVVDVVRSFCGDRPLLDVCTQPDNPIGADAFYSLAVGRCGMSTKWTYVFGERYIAWCNPPFSRGQVQRWAERAVEQALLGAEILMLTKDDCRTSWSRYLRNNADARCRIDRGVGFLEPDGNGGYKQLVGPQWGSCIWYWGPRRRRFDRIFGAIGEVTHLLGPSLLDDGTPNPSR
jgi:hypothetical protein